MFWQCLLLLLAFWLIYDHFRTKQLFKPVFHLPEVDLKSFPLIGQAYVFLGSGEDRMNGIKKLCRMTNKLGGVTRQQFGRRPFLVVTDAEIAESILKHCLEKDDMVDSIRYVTANGSLFAPVSIWRPRRKVLAPTFSPKMLNQFTPVFAKGGQELVENLKQVPSEEPLSLWNYLTTFTMDAVCETTLNVKISNQVKEEHPFLTAFKVGSDYVAERLLQPWLQVDFIYKLMPQYKVMRQVKKTLYDFIDEIIKKKRKSIELNNKNNIKPDFETFLDKLMEPSHDNILLSDEEVREECLVMAMAGTDTSAVGSCFTLCMLAKYPHVQEKVHNEIKEVLGNSNRLISNEDLNKLKYLDAVVRESLRLYPPVPAIVRKATKHVTLPSGLQLFPGMGMFIFIWGVHRNPAYWGPDADVFRPERFLDSQPLHPAAFMPFSNGPRSCLGYQYAMMSIKSSTASVIREFQILPKSDLQTNYKPSTETETEESFRLKYDIMMKDMDNFIVRLSPRHK